ncbi:hypothetical protein CR513_17519, partial [Mucuna pruriens]
MNEIHKGIYDFHSSGWAMVARMLKASYYWLMISEECPLYLYKFQECQAHAHQDIVALLDVGNRHPWAVPHG